MLSLGMGTGLHEGQDSDRRRRVVHSDIRLEEGGGLVRDLRQMREVVHEALKW